MRKKNPLSVEPRWLAEFRAQVSAVVGRGAGGEANMRREGFLVTSPLSLEASPSKRGTCERNSASNNGFLLVLKRVC